MSLRPGKRPSRGCCRAWTSAWQVRAGCGSRRIFSGKSQTISTQKKPIKKRARRKNKTPITSRKVALFSFFAGLLVVVGIVAFLFFPQNNSRPSRFIPFFETLAPGNTESIVKHLDKTIYDVLVSLGVQAEQVHFRTVETKKQGNDQWTYSDLDVGLEKPHSPTLVEKIFSDGLSSVKPKPHVVLSVGSNNETIVDISVKGRSTHRLNFFVVAKKMPTPSPRPRRPAVAIIIDDMGDDPYIASRFLELDAQLSFSVLPFSPFTERIATSAHRSGKEVLLHLPMEPIEYPEVDPGEGALLGTMTPDELLSQLNRNIKAVPFAVGVNNHMGSKLTQDSAKMHQIFTVLKRRNLFFVDSVTSSKSCCKQTAGSLRLRFAQRQVFLDHDQEPDMIRFQIKRLISIAKKRGKAIGIGHPYPTTLDVLKKDLNTIKSQVNLVPVSELVG